MVNVNGNSGFSINEKSPSLNLNFLVELNLMIAGNALGMDYLHQSLAFSANACCTSVDIARGLNYHSSIVLKSI